MDEEWAPQSPNIPNLASLAYKRVKSSGVNDLVSAINSIKAEMKIDNSLKLRNSKHSSIQSK